MVGLLWLGYYDGCVVVLRVLLWLDCGGEGTPVVGLRL